MLKEEREREKQEQDIADIFIPLSLVTEMARPRRSTKYAERRSATGKIEQSNALERNRHRQRADMASRGVIRYDFIIIIDRDSVAAADHFRVGRRRRGRGEGEQETGEGSLL